MAENLEGIKTERVRLIDDQTVSKGLGITTAAMFIAGEMAGTGVIALPDAVTKTGLTLVDFESTLSAIVYYIFVTVKNLGMLVSRHLWTCAHICIQHQWSLHRITTRKMLGNVV